MVDFGDPQQCIDGRYWSLGVTTALDPPICPAQLREDPVLSTRFSAVGLKALQGLPKRLSDEHAAAIDRLAGGLPEQRPPARLPRAGDPVDAWFGSLDIDPEKTFELAVYTSKYLWKRVGFPERPAIQQRLAQAGADRLLIPDLLAPGVVGEVKRLLSPDDGPAQIARYLERLARTRPDEGPWRGILIHGDELSQTVRQRLDDMNLAVEVWSIAPATVRSWKAVREYP